MIGKQIFGDKFLKEKAEKVLCEVADYVENQNRNGMLSPDFYDSTLLFIAEMLPHMKTQEPWIDLGYRICRYFKQNMESYGYNRRTAMFGGLGYQCFAVNAFCSQADMLQSFSRSMNQVLFYAIDNRLKEIENSPVCDSNHDMISGISGSLYYLLDCDYTQDEKRVLEKCIKYLVSLTKDTEFDGKVIINFHVLQPNQNPNFDQNDFKRGNINFGLAHGMLGPLIALAKAYAKGFNVDGLQDGIEKVYRLYETFQLVKGDNIPYWPGPMSVEEYWEGACKPEHLHISSSWCYGNIGVIRGLQKVARYMNWKEKERAHIEMMKRIYAQETKNYRLFSPSVCHGFSSLLAIQTCSYSACGDSGLLIQLERNVRQVIKEYQRSNEHEVSLMDIRDGTTWVEGYLKDLSLLTGSTGVAIALLSLKGPMKTGKLLMID